MVVCSAFRRFDDCEGQYADIVAVGFHEVAAVGTGITPNRVADRRLFQEFADVVGRIQRDADHIDAAFFLRFIPCGHCGHFFTAGPHQVAKG